jgi:hypothetical protein
MAQVPETTQRLDHGEVRRRHGRRLGWGHGLAETKEVKKNQNINLDYAVFFAAADAE